MSCGSGGSKSRFAKAVYAEPSGRIRDQKLHAAVVRSTFSGQHAQSASCSEHFGHVSRWKSGCGLISKWEGVVKAPHARTTLKGEMSTKRTMLWPEAHVEVNMIKVPHARTTIGRSTAICRCKYNYNYIRVQLGYTVLAAAAETTTPRQLQPQQQQLQLQLQLRRQLQLQLHTSC